MKTVKILSMALVLSIFCAGMTMAQQQDRKNVQRKEQKGQQTKATAEERASKKIEAMKKELNLSNEQVNKLQNLESQRIKDEGQYRNSKNGNQQQDWKNKMDNYNSQVKSILTPEQYQKWQNQHSNMRNGQGKNAKGKNGNWNKDNKDRKDQHDQKK